MEHSLPVRVGFLVIGRKRPGFDPEWARQMEEAAWAALAESGFERVRPQTRAVDDATLRAALAELAHAACDTLVVLQPSMGDGRLAPVLGQVWNGPVVFWATPERPDGGKVSSCSLVGTHVFATIFRQQRLPFEVAYGDPEAGQARQELTEAIQLCVAAGRLARSKVALVGEHAPGFLNMEADAALLRRALGSHLHRIALDEFIAAVESQEEDAVRQDLEVVRGLGLPMDESLEESDLECNSRYYLALESLRREEQLDAIALRCWPELPNRLKNWPYLAMARLAEEARVVALEGDVDGALTCLIAKLLGLGVGYVSDWLEHDRGGLTLWHPGHAPQSYCEEGSRRLGRHFNNNLPLVVDATLRLDMPVTLLRLWRCDGAYHLTACQAVTAPAPRPLTGAVARAEIGDRDVCQWFRDLCHDGMPHHLTVVQGHHAERIRRFTQLAGIDWIA